MIPSDRITIEGDRAWWVLDYPAPLDQPTVVAVRALNRPCNHCEGLDVEDINCDCIDGRHTFPIEVDDCCGLVEPFCHVTTYRAAIIEVLPIVTERDYERNTAAIEITDQGLALRHAAEHDEMKITGTITLPSAAAPGMYAVRLKLTNKEET